MDFNDKKNLIHEINTDTLLGICLGILGNALYLELSEITSRGFVIILAVVILLILIFMKEEQKTIKKIVKIHPLNPIQDYDKLSIIEKIKTNVGTSWEKTKENKFESNRFKISFLLETYDILKATIDDHSIIVECYDGAECEYLLDKIKDILINYKNKKNENLFNLEDLEISFKKPKESKGNIK